MLKLLGWPNSAPWLVGGALILLMISVWVHQIRQCRQDKNGSSEKHEKAYQEIAPRQPYPNEEEHRASEKAYWVRSIVAQYRTPWLSIFTAAAAAVAAGAAFFTYEQTRRQVREAHTQSVAILQANQMNAESGRAWVAPQNVLVTSPLTIKQPIEIRLTYGNLGKEPAINVHNNVFVALIHVPPKGIDHAFDDFTIPELCSEANAGNSTTVVYPSTAANFQGLDATRNAGNIAYYAVPSDFQKWTSEKKDLDPATVVLSKEFLLMVSACFTYKTAGQGRYSTTCMFLQPSDKATTAWEFHFCPKGNDAT